MDTGSEEGMDTNRWYVWTVFLRVFRRDHVVKDPERKTDTSVEMRLRKDWIRQLTFYSYGFNSWTLCVSWRGTQFLPYEELLLLSFETRGGEGVREIFPRSLQSPWIKIHVVNSNRTLPIYQVIVLFFSEW